MEFSVEIIKLVKYLKDKRESIMSIRWPQRYFYWC